MIRHPHNIGYGRALKDGIAAAQYDIIVITDADGSYPIEEIQRSLPFTSPASTWWWAPARASNTAILFEVAAACRSENDR